MADKGHPLSSVIFFTNKDAFGQRLLFPYRLLRPFQVKKESVSHLSRTVFLSVSYLRIFFYIKKNNLNGLYYIGEMLS